MTTFDDARQNRLNAVPAEWLELRDAMLDELKAFDEAVESKAIRYVKTPAGSRKYGEPIGAPIRPNAPSVGGKLSYVRNGPKKRSSGTSSSSASSGSSASFRSLDVSTEALKDVNKLTPGERGREKARLADVIKKDPKNSSLEKRRFSDIEEHENELDKTVRNPKRDISGATGDKKPKESPAAPKATEGGSKPDDTPTANSNTKPDPKTQPVDKLSDAQLRRQIMDFDRDGTGYRGNPAAVARGRELGAEFSRRGLGASPKAETQANATLAGEPLNKLTTSGLAKEVARLEKQKKRTQAQTTRLLQARIQLNRRRASEANAQAVQLGQFRLKRPGVKSAWVESARLDVDVKTFTLVGDGDWDCSGMSDSDIDYFLAKSLSGRPTAVKLQQANSLLTERASRVEVDEPEVKELSWETV